MTDTGVNERLVEPLPSWPSALKPQHVTAVVAQEQTCWIPAMISLWPLLSPLTSLGVAELLTVASLMPNSPSWLRPQDFTPPELVRAQEWLPPSATAVALFSPVTVTGTLELVVAPLPSCPAPFSPKHFTPLFCTTQVCAPPAKTAVTPEARRRSPGCSRS